MSFNNIFFVRENSRGAASHSFGAFAYKNSRQSTKDYRLLYLVYYLLSTVYQSLMRFALLQSMADEAVAISVNLKSLSQRRNFCSAADKP